MPGIDYQQLRRQISMREVLDLIGFQPTSRRGLQLRGPCPIPGCYSASDRSFSVHLARQVYHCFACRRHGNALDLWAAFRRLSLPHAALDLCRIATIAPPWLPAAPITPPTCQPRRVPLRAPLRNH
jgi:DNA primase